jgi:hypothetical protein
MVGGWQLSAAVGMGLCGQLSAVGRLAQAQVDQPLWRVMSRCVMRL